MIEQYTSLGYLGTLISESRLLMRCLLGNDAKTTMKNVLALSSTSKIFHDVVSTAPFFKNIIDYFDRENPFISKIFKEEADSKVIKKISLKNKYFDLRNSVSKNNETFPKLLFSSGTAFAYAGELGFITFYDQIEIPNQHEIKIFNLKDKSKIQTIEIPPRLLPRKWQKSHHAACSERFLSFNHRCNSEIYTYTRDGKQFMGKHVVAGNICQLEIIGNILCVVEQDPDHSNYLTAFDLKIIEQQKPVRIPLPENTKTFQLPNPICFGEEHLIYIQSLVEGNQIHALPLSCLHKAITGNSLLPWIGGTTISGSRYLFPDGVDFIEVTFKECCVCDIFKMTISSLGILKTELAKNVSISKDIQETCANVCFLNDRLFIAYDDKNDEAKVFSYDIVTGKIDNFLTHKTSSDFHVKPRFLRVADEVSDAIYYLFINLNGGVVKSSLITLIYGKV